MRASHLVALRIPMQLLKQEAGWPVLPLRTMLPNLVYPLWPLVFCKKIYRVGGLVYHANPVFMGFGLLWCFTVVARSNGL